MSANTIPQVIITISDMKEEINKMVPGESTKKMLEYFDKIEESAKIDISLFNDRYEILQNRIKEKELIIDSQNQSITEFINDIGKMEAVMVTMKILVDSLERNLNKK